MPQSNLELIFLQTIFKRMPMFGLQEILIVIAIILAILFFPRIMNRSPARPAWTGVRISAKMRIALVLSLIYPALAAAYFQPWHTDPVLFYYAGAGPVISGWLFFWVLSGF